MASSPVVEYSVPWYKEPTKDQWYAYMAAWLGWTLDAFDFTVFLLTLLASGGPGAAAPHGCGKQSSTCSMR